MYSNEQMQINMHIPYDIYIIDNFAKWIHLSVDHYIYELLFTKCPFQGPFVADIRALTFECSHELDNFSIVLIFSSKIRWSFKGDILRSLIKLSLYTEIMDKRKTCMSPEGHTICYDMDDSSHAIFHKIQQVCPTKRNLHFKQVMFNYVPDILAAKWSFTSKLFVLHLIMLGRLGFKYGKNVMKFFIFIAA